MFPPPTPDEVAADPSTSLLVVLLGAFVVLGALVWRSYRSAEAANRAVNGIGPEEHRLYDRVAMLSRQVEVVLDKQDHTTVHIRELVAESREFSNKGWRALPPDLATGPALAETIRALQEEARRNHAEHERIMELLDRLTDGD